MNKEEYSKWVIANMIGGWLFVMVTVIVVTVALFGA